MNNFNKISFLKSLKEKFQEDEILFEEITYSLLSDSKLTRPELLYNLFSAYSYDTSKYLDVAIALEMIHTYSLIHDDLPAMDNDSYRRGKLTNHLAFSEAHAILAGDALLTRAFEVISTSLLYTSDEKVLLITALTKASGNNGMIGGQVKDIESINKQLSLNELNNMHLLKTGALFNFCNEVIKIILQKDTLTLCNDLGLYFQIQDDLLSLSNTNKSNDFEENKATYINILGVENTKIYLQNLESNIVKNIKSLPNNLLFLQFFENLKIRIK